MSVALNAATPVELAGTSWTREQFESLGNGIWVVDEPLLDQLALVEACDLFLSPHTGFGCAAASTGDSS